MNNESNDTYTVVLIPCENSKNIGTYGQYETLKKAEEAANVFDNMQKTFKQSLTTSQLSNFVENMPVIVKNYERNMSVRWILFHRISTKGGLNK